jgi:hypothetical protein
MKNWIELESRFRSLAPGLQHARLDDQTGAAGEYWRLAGGFDHQAVRQFETLSLLAGTLLVEALAGQPDAKPILEGTDPKIRWYRALKAYSESHEIGPSGYQKNDAGENLGWIHSGSIQNIGEVAANVSLYLQARHPIRARWYKQIYDDYGKKIVIGLVLALAAALIGLWLK